MIEVGNVMYTPALQRTAGATEAQYLFATYVFDTLGYRRYEWKCNALNAPSRRAAERLGFTFEGVFRQHMIVKGRNRDTAWFSMLDGEWPARKAAFERWLRRDNFDAGGRQKESLLSLVPAAPTDERVGLDRPRAPQRRGLLSRRLAGRQRHPPLAVARSALEGGQGRARPLGEIFRRHALHHRTFPRFDKPAHDDATLYALDIDGRVTAAMVVLLAAPFLLVDWVTAVTMAVAVVLHNHIYNVIHCEMHAPRGRWFSRTRLFRYYVRYHFLHHRHPADALETWLFRSPTGCSARWGLRPRRTTGCSPPWPPLDAVRSRSRDGRPL